MKRWPVLLALCAACSSNEPRPEPAASRPGAEARSELLALDFDAFDQDLAGGWRVLEARGDPLAAAQLLDAYRDAHPELRPWQRTLATFHAGQMYAESGRTEPALARFRAAGSSPDVGPGWSPYVRATIAFLERDRAALERARDELAAAPYPEGEDPNLRVVESLLDRFDEPYASAYAAAAAR